MAKYLNLCRLVRCALALILLGVSNYLLAECKQLDQALRDKYPSYQQKTLSTERGRLVSWSQVGSDDGVPVLYAHGNPGSRFELLFFHDVAVELGLNLMLMERPGFGCSEYVEGYSLADYAEDVARLLRDQKIDSPVKAFGWSSGGPPTMALGAYLPGSVSRLAVASSYTNFGEMSAAKAIMKEYHRPGPALSDRAPRLFHGLVWMVGWASHRIPNVYFRMTEHEVSSSDKRLLEMKYNKTLFMLNQESAFEQGAEGAIHDLEVQWQPWPFQLASVETPLLLLQGLEDKLVPKEFVFHMHSKTMNSELVTFEKEGHLFPLNVYHQKEIFFWLLQ